MLGKDPASQFDYLFEPLNGGGADENNDDTGPPAIAQLVTNAPRSAAAPNRFVLAGIVLAVMVAAAATVIFLLASSDAGRVDPPMEPVPLATTESTAPSQPVLVVPPTETIPAIEPPVDTAIVGSDPPQPEPTTAGGGDAGGRPVTRAPISVEPAPRQPFPGQNPSRGSGQSPVRFRVFPDHRRRRKASREAMVTAPPAAIAVDGSGIAAPSHAFRLLAVELA